MIRDDRQMENLHPATFSGSLVAVYGYRAPHRQETTDNGTTPHMWRRHTGGGLDWARRDMWRQW